MNTHKIKSALVFVLLASLAGLIVRLSVLENFRISSRSMVPSLLPGDLVFVAKSTYNVRLPFSTVELLRFARPKPSDVVVFSLPDRGVETFVKRVVAGEGDKLQIKDGKLYVNDREASYRPTEARQIAQSGLSDVWEQLPEQPARRIRMDENSMKDYGPVDIPTGHFFALGDNRAESVDSRSWGPVPYSCLKGKVELVWLSIDSLNGIRGDRRGIWVQ